MEIRRFRDTSRKLVEAEERGKFLKNCLKHKVGLGEEENAILNSNMKFRVLGNKGDIIKKRREEGVLLVMKYKVKDNILFETQMRRKRNCLRGKIEASLGGRSHACRKLMEEVKRNGNKHRKEVRMKMEKKLQHLVRKYGVRSRSCRDLITKDELEFVGNPSLFMEDGNLEGEVVRNPAVVVGEGEELVLTEEEIEVLKLGPKFCLYKNLSEEEFEADLEETIMKIKWDMMGEEQRGKERTTDDVAMEVLLGKKACVRIEDEKEEEEEFKDAESRSIFDWSRKTVNYARRRATDLKGNSRVYFPRTARSLETESNLQTLRGMLMTTFGQYVREFCGKKGIQRSNLSKSQEEGLASLRKRVKEGEVVIVPTDKSGTLAAMSRRAYMEAGMVHTRNDKEVGWEEVRDSQKELNGHTSMLIKSFRIGGYWKHGDRVRETMMGEGQAVCPLSLLYKDHKGWDASKGPTPPTRPVAGGHIGINMHISEIVSDLLDPVVAVYRGGREIISTEDLLARVVLMNELQEGWSCRSFWRNLTCEEYRSCMVCDGEDEYCWDDDAPELCRCEEMDGIDEEGHTMITAGAMRKLRRVRWEEASGWDPQDMKRKYGVCEMLEEDVQDQAIPMVVIGTDVESLYPSLNIEEVVKEVREAVYESRIEWEEVDYLEMARYVALNWSEDQCRRSKLGRILPRRRKNQGSRPGLRGEGPLGAERGDQEQWVFQKVRLRREEKRLLVATVLELAATAMFSHHYYEFGGRKFRQMGGGPIGLRGTCTLARLVMQVYDRKWEAMVKEAGVKLNLYMRYMDDGRKFLHPIRKGWRWEGGSLQYSRGWEVEDMNKSPLDVTIAVLRDSVKGVLSYLSFTFESGQDFDDGWLPTLDTSLRVGGNNCVEFKYYEKPTTANFSIHAASAMAENPKVQCLSNDVVRRLMNTMDELPGYRRAEVVDGYGIKLLTSGYSREQVMKIVANGVKGYLRKRKRRTVTGRGRRIHLTAQESQASRIRKRMLGKSSWYKKRGVEEESSPPSVGGRDRQGDGVKDKGNSLLRTRAVLFVEQSPHGELAKRMREQLRGLEPTIGFRIKVVERTGRSLKGMLAKGLVLESKECGRVSCVTCAQEGVEKPPCLVSSVVYESICKPCNPGCTGKGEVEYQGVEHPSLYVGETSRTIQERAVEHLSQARRGDQRSHMVRHQTLQHPGEPPSFQFKVVSSHRSALSRQIREAVRIRRRGGAGQILNSKGEFNRCHIPRLVVEEEDEEVRKRRMDRELREKQEMMMSMDMEVME